MVNARTLLTIPLLVIAACGEDPQGPCDVPNACRYEGPHFVASLELSGSHPVVAGLPGVSPGAATFHLNVSNQGDSATAPALLTVGLAGAELAGVRYEYLLPAMLPGDVREGTITLDIEAPYLVGTDTSHAWLRIEPVEGAAEPLAEAVTDDFRVLLPVLEFQLLEAPDTVVFGARDSVAIRLVNRSPGAAFEPEGLHLQLRNTTWSDSLPVWPTIELPAIPANGTYEQAVEAVAPGNAGFWLDGYNHLNGTEAQQIYDQYQTYRLRACVGTGEVLCDESAQMVRGRIDMEACTGGVAIVGETVPVTIPCTDTYPGPVAVWRFHAAAGDMFQFHVTNAGGIGVTRVLERDGTLVASYNSMNPAPLLQQAGDYYLIFWSVQYPLTQPTLTTEQLTPPPGAAP